jgi:uncharacterized phiE125 gp8 family phage protein
MSYGIEQIVAPTDEPVHIDEVLEYCRITNRRSDRLIERWIRAARRKVETDARVQLMAATWRMTFDQFPYQWNVDRQNDLYQVRQDGRNTWALQQVIQMPLPPLQSIVQVAYQDLNSQQEVVDPTTYQVDTVSKPGRLLPSYGLVWPIALLEANAVLVDFVAGYSGRSAVPDNLVLAIMELVSHWYSHREAAVDGAPPAVIPLGYDDLIWMDRDYRIP